MPRAADTAVFTVSEGPTHRETLFGMGAEQLTPVFCSNVAKPVMWRPTRSSRQLRAEGRFGRHIRRRSPGPLKLLPSRRLIAELPRTPDASTSQFTVIEAFSFGSTSGGL